MSAEIKKAILDYVLVEICEVNVDSLKKNGISLTIHGLMNLEGSYWQDLEKRKVICGLEVQMILNFQKMVFVHEEGRESSSRPTLKR